VTAPGELIDLRRGETFRREHQIESAPPTVLDAAGNLPRLAVVREVTDGGGAVGRAGSRTHF
jgi:hypothetical protein